MQKRNLTIPILISFLMIGLTVSGYFFPGNLNWGYHFLGLLPLPYLLCYLVATASVIVYVLVGNTEAPISFAVARIGKRPLVAIILLFLVFIGMAIGFRQRIPLLGDSFLLINNYENTLTGLHDLIIYREPLSVYFFYWMAKLLQTSTYPAIMNTFRTGEIILGVGFIINVVLSIKCFVPGTRERILSVLFLLAGAYMQVFLGYAEIYSVELFFISLYIVVVALWMRGKLPFHYVPVAFMFQVFSHYLTVLLLPSFLIIAYSEYKEKGLRNILIGCASSAAILILLILTLDLDLKRFIPTVSHSPFLSIFPTSDGFQAYTMFSLYHLTDLISLWMLLGSSSIILLGILAVFGKRNLLDSIQVRFLLACAIPIVFFAAVAKFDLGMPNDWDTMAPYFFVVNLFALIAFLHIESPGKERTVLLCLAIAVFNTAVWVKVNASESPTLTRTGLLRDERIISQQGFFHNTYHIENYYAYRGDLSSIVALWEQYIERYPADEMGYRRAAEYLVKSGKQTSQKTLSLMERWLSVNPDNPEAKGALAKICVNAGEGLLTNGNVNEAKGLFRKAIRLDSLTIMAYYNLGTMYLQNGNIDSAIEWYSKAIQIDSTFLLSFDGLGLAYMRQGDDVSALAVVQASIERDTTNPNSYFRLAQIYHRMGDQENSVESLRKAARLGNPYAQDLLTKSNITW